MKKTLSLLSLLFVCVLAGAQTKSVSVLGDSYSTFEGAIPKSNAIWYFKRNNPNQTDVNKLEQTWWSLLIADKGWKLEMNESYSGSTICNTGYNKDDYSDRSFTKRMVNLGNPDIIFIFGATNDSWAHSPIGEYKYDDITTDDLWSFRPAMAKMLAWMKEHYAKSSIYFVLNDGLSQEVTESSKTICDSPDHFWCWERSKSLRAAIPSSSWRPNGKSYSMSTHARA